MDRLYDQKNTLPIEDTKNHQDHFLKGREAWNEVYGRSVSAMRNWRNLSFVLAIVLLAAIAGLTWQGTQSKVIPYVVVLDKEGQQLHAGVAAKNTTMEEKLVKAELENFVKKVRLASMDRQLMLQGINFVYAHLKNSTPAQKKLNAHFQENNPFELISKQTRIVDKVTSVLPVTDNTWAIEWAETTRSITNGDILKTENYKAIATVLQQEPVTAEQWTSNPFGLWIINFEWELKK